MLTIYCSTRLCEIIDPHTLTVMEIFELQGSPLYQQDVIWERSMSLLNTQGAKSQQGPVLIHSNIIARGWTAALIILISPPTQKEDM